MRPGRELALTGRKVCPACRKELTHDAFSACSSRWDGLSTYCRPCDAKRRRRYAKPKTEEAPDVTTHDETSERDVVDVPSLLAVIEAGGDTREILDTARRTLAAKIPDLPPAYLTQVVSAVTAMSVQMDAIGDPETETHAERIARERQERIERRRHDNEHDIIDAEVVPDDAPAADGAGDGDPKPAARKPSRAANPKARKRAKRG